VNGTGIPKVDRADLKAALARVAVNGTITLKGHFNLGAGCVLCLKVHQPVTIQGVGNPAVTSPSETTVTIVQGGLAPFAVLQDVRGAAIRFRNIWFRGQVLIAVAALRTLDRLEFTGDRVTNVSPLFLAVEQFRFAFGAATLPFPSSGTLDSARVKNTPQIASHITALKKAGVPGAPTLAELEARYPGIGPLFNPSDLLLKGSLALRGNYVDFLTAPGTTPFRFGDDNAIGIADCEFGSISIEHNYFATRGETEIEGCQQGLHPGQAHYTITDNTIQTDSPPSFEGLLVPQGGHPAAIKVIGDGGSATVMGNSVSVWGAPEGVAVLAGNTNPSAFSAYENNYFQASGQRTLFMGGFAATPGFFPPSSLQDALIRDNTFTGTIREGIAFVNLPGILSPPLINRANRVTIEDNNFAGLTSRRATVVFGPGTFDNTFIGNPNGPIINKGTGNTIVITQTK
jgi:hypothetical protein